MVFFLGVWCLQPLSTIFQLYHGVFFLLLFLKWQEYNILQQYYLLIN